MYGVLDANHQPVRDDEGWVIDLDNWDAAGRLATHLTGTTLQLHTIGVTMLANPLDELGLDDDEFIAATTGGARNVEAAVDEIAERTIGIAARIARAVR